MLPALSSVIWRPIAPGGGFGLSVGTRRQSRRESMFSTLSLCPLRTWVRGAVPNHVSLQQSNTPLLSSATPRHLSALIGTYRQLSAPKLNFKISPPVRIAISFCLPFFCLFPAAAPPTPTNVGLSRTSSE